MITRENISPVERSGIVGESTFHIKANAKAFDILSSGLYSDKIKAVVRELSCNAYDAHVVAGNADQPIEIHLPTQLDPTFYVRDFGTGLSHEQIVGRWEEEVIDDAIVRKFVPGIYQTFFDSNKQTSNDVIGCLGLGSKSPFSYTSQFMVESRFEGMKRTYNAFKNEEGLPTVVLMQEEPTEEHAGMTISMCVRPADIDKFTTAAKKALMYFTPRPAVVGQSSFKPYDLRHTVTGDGWKIRESEYYAYMTGPYVVQGFVAYPVDQYLLNEHTTLSPMAAALCSIDLDLYVPIGSVDVAPSREALGYDKVTIANLACSLEQAAEEMRTSFQATFDKCETLWEAAMMLDKLSHGPSDKFKVIFNQMHKDQPFTWNGAEVDQTVTIKMDTIDDLMIQMASLNTSGRKVCWSDSWTCEHGDHYEFTIQGALTILVDTDCKGKGDIIRQYLTHAQKVNGHKPRVMLIRPVGKDLFKQDELDALIKMFGSPKYEFVDNLPYKVTKLTRQASGTKRDKATKLVWSGFMEKEGRGWRRSTTTHRVFSRKTWRTEVIDLTEGGIYIELERFNALTKSGAIFSNLDTFISNAQKLGLLEDDFQLIGLNKKEIAAAQKVGEWVNLIDEVTINFELDNENNELFNRSVLATTHERINEHTSYFTKNVIDKWDIFQTKLNDGPFKTFVESLREFAESAADVDADVVNELAGMCKIKVDTEDLVNAHVDEFKHMWSKYSMFPLIDWSRMNFDNINRVAEYVNTVDFPEQE